MNIQHYRIGHLVLGKGVRPWGGELSYDVHYSCYWRRGYISSVLVPELLRHGHGVLVVDNFIGFFGFLLFEYCYFFDSLNSEEGTYSYFYHELNNVFSLGSCYFHFINLGETARRIRILREFTCVQIMNKKSPKDSL